MSEAVELRAGDARLVVSRHGAEARRWRIGNRDLLWSPDASVWNAVSPVLFPVVGWCRDAAVRVDGRTYPMGVHGFAAGMDFDVVEQRGDFVRLRLGDSAASRLHFPFAFRLDVAYALGAEGFGTRLEVANTGDRPMPYACGVHPGFAWPFDGGAPEDYEVIFAQAERGEVPVIAPGGLFAHETRPVPLDGARLALSHDLFAREALCFVDARSTSLLFARRGGAAIGMRVGDFPHLALWSRAGAPFLCLEAWTGHGDGVDFGGDIFAKPSMRLLAPGEKGCHETAFRFHAGGAPG